MKLLALLLAASIVMVGCASSDKNENDKEIFENLVTLQTPDKQKVEKARVYIDSVTAVQRNDNRVLLISGSFPDGCTHLGQVTHSGTGHRIQLSLEAWRDPEMMCTQALTPFSFIYDKLSEQEYETLSSVTVNGTTYELK